MKRRAPIVLLGIAACIVPDREIRFEGGPANEGAVRILARAPVPSQWDAWCLDRVADEQVSEDVDEGTASFCPNVAATKAGGLIHDPAEPLCICPDAQRDARAPLLWTIYAEDPDLDGDVPQDALYGVLLIDPDPADGEPSAAVAYENYLEPCAPGVAIDARQVAEPRRDADGGRVYPVRVEPPVARNTAPQWRFDIDDASSDLFDLCNDDNGTALGPGLHNLQFMVTDRPFFRAMRDDVERLQCGVPDVAAGATYAVINYVFECVDGTLEENEDQCACEDSDE